MAFGRAASIREEDHVVRYPDNRPVSRGRPNVLTTSQYTIFNFVPLNLLQQFRKQANLYFLIISIVMLIGEKTPLFVGTIKAWSTAGMLGMMMTVSGVVAALDDMARHKSDAETNSKDVKILDRNSSVTERRWDAVSVGDVLIVKNQEEIPADMVVLRCFSDDGACFVSTASLDGETHLKPKVAALKGVKPEDESELGRILDNIKFEIKKEAPQKSIYSFSGSLKLGDAEEQPLEMRNVLLRGSVLRNVEWCVGIVIYTGNETRIMMNSRKVPMKLPNLEVVINKAMWVAIAVQAVMALVVDLLFNFVEKKYFRSLWYLYPDGFVHPEGSLPDLLAYWVTFFVLFSNLMPVSLYATMEVCNKAYAYFIANDKVMGEGGAVARATNLCHELGQVSYIFSDKTGTLTKNIMELKDVYIGGKEHPTGHNGSQGEAPPSKATKDFWRCVTLCHTVVRGKDGSYEAESPDEDALVTAAKNKGYEFEGRTTEGDQSFFKVKTSEGVETFEIMAVNAFNSTRKKMSVVVKDRNGDYFLMVKGADNEMFSGAKADGEQEKQRRSVIDFSNKGFRTLVLGSRKIEQAKFTEWHGKYLKAQVALEGREESLNELAVEIEKDFTVLGVTAIEDKLQDDVGTTIEKLRNAGIKVWVLTGDKLETAKVIGFSTQVLTRSMEIVEEREGDFQEFDAKTKESQGGQSGKEYALLITGQALEKMMANEKKIEQFLAYAQVCKVVICCRVSPLQKAQMVELVRTRVKVSSVTGQPVTLAVGDGANDVPMIQAAQVGVGIYGREGRQAANASDFAIQQFKYLMPLLLVHGHWNYRRACIFTLFTFWRNSVQVLLMCYYTMSSGYSGTTLFEDKLRITFNGFCSIPILATGMFNCDYTRAILESKPDLYKFGREGRDLSPFLMFGSTVSALAHSLVILAVSYAAFPSMEFSGIGDYWSFGAMVFTILVIGVAYRVAFLTATWNAWSWITLAMSLGGYFCFLEVYGALKLTPTMYQVPRHILSAPVFWVCVLATLCLQLLVDVVIWLLFNCREDPVETPQGTGAESRQEDGPSEPQLSKAAFLQQELPSFQLVKTKARMVAVLPCLAIVLASLALLVQFSGVRSWIDVKYGQDASGNLEVDVLSHGVLRKRGHHAAATAPRCHANVCSFDLVMQQSMAAPVSLYYSVDPFYQNYQYYLKAPTGATLALTNVFNDTFTIKGLKIDKTDIAWNTDKAIFSKHWEEYSQNNGKDGTVITEDDFDVWMRPGAFANTKKLYGRLDRPLNKDEKLTVEIRWNFPVDGINAVKQLLLTEETSTGIVASAKLVGVLWLSAATAAAAFVVSSLLLCAKPSDARQTSRVAALEISDFSDPARPLLQ